MTWKSKFLQSERTIYTVFEKSQKSLIQHCERSELRLHFEWPKVHQKCQNLAILATYWKPEACDQTALPDRSVLISGKIGRKCQNWKIAVCGQTVQPDMSILLRQKLL